MPLHACLRKALLPACGQLACAHAVHQQMHTHATLGSAHHGLGHMAGLPLEVKDVGLQRNAALRTIHGLHHGGKQVLPTDEQAHSRGRRGVHAGAHANSAISGKWSDMRPQIRPLGTSVFCSTNPRAYT